MTDAPPSFEIKWCPVCGRTDRRTNLPASHAVPNGGPRSNCSGTPRILTYALASLPNLAKEV